MKGACSTGIRYLDLPISVGPLKAGEGSLAFRPVTRDLSTVSPFLREAHWARRIAQTMELYCYVESRELGAGQEQSAR
jgi:hypothetical protein